MKRHQGRGGRGLRLGDGIRDVLRPLAAARQKDPRPGGLHRPVLGMCLLEEAVGRAGQAQQFSHSERVGPRDHRRRQYHQVRVHLHRPAQQRVLRPHHQTVPPLVDFRWLPPSVDDPLLLHPVVELLVPFAEGPHVNVEDGDPGVREFIPHQVRVLGGVHAANPGAVRNPGVRVPGADAVDEDHVLRLLPIEDDFPSRRPGGRGEPLKLQPRDDVGIDSVAELRFGARVHQVKPGGDDDRRHVHLHEPLLLLKVDGVRGAGVLA